MCEYAREVAGCVGGVRGLQVVRAGGAYCRVRRAERRRVPGLPRQHIQCVGRRARGGVRQVRRVQQWASAVGLWGLVGAGEVRGVHWRAVSGGEQDVQELLPGGVLEP